MLKRLAAVLALCVVPPALAAEDPARLPLSGYAAPAMPLSAAKVAQPWEAPAVRAGDTGGVRKSTRGCENAELELCIGADGRITVPGAKKFLPELPGLTPERLTVKRSGIVLGYSF
jgi:hypothetical protein